MIRSDIRAYINIGALIIVLLVNYLSNALPLNNLTQEELSAINPVLITPAPYVFAIWGLIYLALTAFVVYQALPQFRENPAVKAVGILFAVSCIFNVLWIFLWHYQNVGWSLIAIIFFLATLIFIYIRLGAVTADRNTYDRFLVRFPFSLYLGWLSAATIVNINVWLYSIGWLGTGTGGALFTVLMIIIAALVALAVFYLRQDYIFAAVFVWAIIGIGARHGSDIPIITVVAWFVAAAIIFCLGWITARKGDLPYMQK